jgi:hypothetical protein
MNFWHFHIMQGGGFMLDVRYFYTIFLLMTILYVVLLFHFVILKAKIVLGGRG